MDWKSFLIQLAAAAAAGALQGLNNQLGTTGGKVQWKPIGNSALIGGLIGLLTHVATTGTQQPPAQPEPAK